MKKWSRLTALMLAFVIMFSTVSGALAAVEVDYGTLLDWIQNVKESQGLGDVIKLDRGGDVVFVPESFVPSDWPLYNVVDQVELRSYALADAPDLGVVLDQYGKVDLSAPTAGQWQVYLKATDTWVNVSGENDSTFALTFAKVQSLFAENNAAQLRCLMGDNVTETVNVQLTYATAALPVQEETESGLMYAVKKNANSDAGIATAADDGTYDITVQFVMDDGSMAYTPWVANMPAGSSLTPTITVPSIMGYKPRLDTPMDGRVTLVDAKTLKLNFTNISSDINIKITYIPDWVTYTVLHHQQNVDNDKYTLKDTKYHTGLTKSLVPEVAANVEGTISDLDYPGFYALLYEKPAIAADGKTVVEVYYDRNYYLMNFTLGEGAYGTEPIYARYGAPLGKIKEPTRVGYTFLGWSLDGTNVVAEMPTTMPAEKRTYIAIWQAATEAKVTVVLWGETANCTDENKEYDYYRSGTVIKEVGTEYTYGNETLNCTSEAHTHTDECIDCGKEEHNHSLDKNCYTLNCDQTSHNHKTDGCTLSCNKEENHSHVKSCYGRVAGDKASAGIDSPSNPQNGYIARKAFSASGKVIYINGSWYEYSGNLETGSVASATCGKEENHQHGDSCYTCGEVQFTHVHSLANGCYDLTCKQTPHEHSSACYGCGKAEHTHTADCTINVSQLFPSNLWTKVEAETREVLPDGSTVVNVYYDRTEFTLTFKGSSNYGGTNTTYGTIKDKWGADIEERFFDICETAYSGTYSWSEKTGGGGPWTSYIGIMPQEDRTYYAYNASGTMTAYYYFQTLDGDYNDKEGNVKTVVAEGSGFSVTDEDRAEFEGFLHDASISTQNGSSFNGAKFYYTRNSYTLDFNNGIDVVRSETVKYQAPLSTYAGYTPTAPSIYEPGSVVFGGWYQNRECTGVQFDLTRHTMPADSMILYAKWVPVNYTVEFYLDREAYEAGTKLSTHSDVTVSHGSFVTPTPSKPDNGDYTFVSWFYEEDGVEKAFDFANMPVKTNLKVYGKWSSNVLKQYFVYYKAEIVDEETGEPKVVEVASPTTGSARAGDGKTFDAKGPDELYPGYQEGYFPVVPSHTITLNIEDDTKNTFTFWYIQTSAVPYKVYYKIKDENGNLIPAITNTDGTEYIKEVNDNRKAIVTETFEVVPGYMPNAYQQQLVLTVDENGNPNTEENVIVFIYTKDTEHAYYKVTHYVEYIDAEGNSRWEEYTKPSQIVGDIGQTDYEDDQLDIAGFTYVKTEYEVDGAVVTTPHALTEAGLEINLYYERNDYPYEVRYLEQTTGNKLHDPKIGTAPYNTDIAENAIAIENYVAVEPVAQKLTIKIEETAMLNVITFYYKEKEVTLNYEVVGPAGCGTVDLNDIDGTPDAKTKDSEMVQVINGKPVGATAAASSNTYKFVGWYDANGGLLSENASYKPTKAEGATWVDGTTYYAKFDWNVADLTITKDGLTATNGTDSAIFKVTGYTADSAEQKTWYVSLANGGTAVIKDLQITKPYTVTEMENWSVYYEKTAVQDGTIQAGDNIVSFTNKPLPDKWLHDESYEVNFED